MARGTGASLPEARHSINRVAALTRVSVAPLTQFLNPALILPTHDDDF
ncbi:MAG: hypothetical protein ABI632_14085 [Pseudolysinimonas sp.]